MSKEKKKGRKAVVARRPKSTAIGNACPLCGAKLQRVARHMEEVHQVDVTKQLELLRSHMCITGDRLKEFPASCRSQLVTLLEGCGHIVSAGHSSGDSTSSEPAADVPLPQTGDIIEAPVAPEAPDLSQFDFVDETDADVVPGIFSRIVPEAVVEPQIVLAGDNENVEVPQVDPEGDLREMSDPDDDNRSAHSDDCESDGFNELLQSYSDDRSKSVKYTEPSRVSMKNAGLYARISSEKVAVLGEEFRRFLSAFISSDTQLERIIDEVGQILHFLLKSIRMSPSALKSIESTRKFVADSQDEFSAFVLKLESCDTSPSNVLNYLKAYGQFVHFLTICKKIKDPQTRLQLEGLRKVLAHGIKVQQKAVNVKRGQEDALAKPKEDFRTMTAFLKLPQVKQRLDEILKKESVSEADYLFLLRYLITVSVCKTGQRPSVAVNFTLKQFGNKQVNVDEATGHVCIIFPLAKTKIKNGRGHQFVVDQYDYDLMKLYARKFRPIYHSKLVEYMKNLAEEQQLKEQQNKQKRKPLVTDESFFISTAGKPVRATEDVVAFQAVDLGLTVTYLAGDIRTALATTARSMGLPQRKLLDLCFTQQHHPDTAENHYTTNRAAVVASGYRLAQEVSEYDGKSKRPEVSPAAKRRRTDTGSIDARVDRSDDVVVSDAGEVAHEAFMPSAAVETPDQHFVDNTDEVVAGGVFADDYISEPEPETNIDAWKELSVKTAEEFLQKYKNSSSKYIDAFKNAFFRRFPVDIDENFTLRLEDLRRILPRSLNDMSLKENPATVAARNLQDLWKGELLKQRLAQLERDCYNSTDKAEVVVRRQLAKRGWTIANKKLQQFFAMLKANGPVKQSDIIAADPIECVPKGRQMPSAALNDCSQVEFGESGSLPTSPVKADRVYSRNRVSPLKSAANSQQPDAQRSDADHSSAKCGQILKAVISQYSSSHQPGRPYFHPNTAKQGEEKGMCAARAIAGSLVTSGAEKPRMKKLTAQVASELRSYSKSPLWFTLNEVVLYFLRRTPFTPFVVLNCQPSAKPYLYSYGISEAEPQKVAVVALCGENGDHWSYACKRDEVGATRIKIAIDYDGDEVELKTTSEIEESRERLSSLQETLRKSYLALSERARAVDDIEEGWFDPDIPMHAEVWAEMQEGKEVLEKPKHKKRKKKDNN